MKARIRGNKWEVRANISGVPCRFVGETEQVALDRAKIAKLEAKIKSEQELKSKQEPKKPKKKRGKPEQQKQPEQAEQPAQPEQPIQPRKPKPTHPELILENYINTWMETVEYVALKKNSWKRKLQAINKHVVPYIGNIYITELDGLTIQSEVINRMAHAGYSYSTIKKSYNALTSMYKYAIFHKDVQYSPCVGVTLPPETHEENEPMTEEDAALFEAECLKVTSKGKPVHLYGFMYVLIMNTGLRSCEGRGLKVKDFTIIKHRGTPRPILKIRRSVVLNEHGRTVIQENTKNGKSRDVTLNKKACKMVEMMSRDKGPEDYLILGKNNTLIREDNFVRSFHEICDRAGIEYHYTGPHCLRHTYATMMFRQGFDAVTLQKQLGHSSIEVTLDIYTHALKNGEMEKMLAMGDILE